MPASSEVVITGLGVISPIGVGREAFWAALREGRNGIGPLRAFDPSEVPVRLAAEVHDFDPRAHIQPRKSLKVMARDVQFGVAASNHARADAGLGPEDIDPDRLGVIFGADPLRQNMHETATTFRACMVDGKFDYRRWAREGIAETFPLEMLKMLPNMLSCHISIGADARGPVNTIYQSEVSGLLAIGEATRVIQRFTADAMLAGAASSRMHPWDWITACMNGAYYRGNGDPARASRPFDRLREGQIRGEGGAAILLENRQHALTRGATILARVAGWGSAYGPLSNGSNCYSFGMRAAISRALEDACMTPDDIGYISARGLGVQTADAQEAAVLAEMFPGPPVTAPKSMFGNLEAAGAAVEIAAAALALHHGVIPPTRNYEHPDPRCPVRVVSQPEPLAKPAVLVVGQTNFGQAAAMILRRDE